MADFEVGSVFWLSCMMCVAPLKIHCQLVKVYGVSVTPWKQADNGEWLSTVAGQMLAYSDLSTKHVHYRWCVADTFSCWCCQRARHSLGSAQNCPEPTGLHRSECVRTGCQRILQMMTKLTVWAVIVSIGHVTLIKESSFGAETWLMTQNLKPEKGCVREKLSSSSSKENGSIVISKDDWKTVLGP